MKNLLLFVFCLSFGNCFAEMHETLVTDTVYVKQEIVLADTSYSIKYKYNKGDWMLYYDSAHTQKAYYIHHNDTNKTVSSKSWYRNGQLKSEIPPYKWMTLDRFDEQQWYADGKIKSARKCFKDSCVTVNYYPAGQIAEKTVARPDSSDLLDSTAKKHGAKCCFMRECYRVEYYENGQIKYDPYNPSGPMQTVVFYYASGKPRYQNDLMYGAIVGPFKMWYENGQPRLEGAYEIPVVDTTKTQSQQMLSVYTSKTGTWTYYDTTGKKVKAETYLKNALVKTEKF